MELLQMLLNMAPSFQGLPYVGPVVHWALTAFIVVMGSLGAVSALVSGFVAVWHGAVQMLNGAALLPYVGPKLAKAAAWLQAEDSKITDWESGKFLPFIDRFSAIKLPQKPEGSSVGVAASSSQAAK